MDLCSTCTNENSVSFSDLVIVAEKLFSVSPVPAELQKALPLYLNHFQFFQQRTEEQVFPRCIYHQLLSVDTCRC